MAAYGVAASYLAVAVAVRLRTAQLLKSPAGPGAELSNSARKNGVRNMTPFFRRSLVKRNRRAGDAAGPSYVGPGWRYYCALSFVFGGIATLVKVL
jgi:hypothetical protein